LARLLLGNGAEVDEAVSEGLYEGQTPLYVACGNGHVNAARLLLDKGAKVNRATRNGNTPMSIAKKNGHSSVVALLEEYQK
jgi:ankyrin repeat protein